MENNELEEMRETDWQNHHVYLVGSILLLET